MEFSQNHKAVKSPYHVRLSSYKNTTGTTKRVDEETKRMQWASRRGMLELDLILEPFVREHFDKLSVEDRIRYRSLMECQDQELFGWFLRREQPSDPKLRAIVTLILDSQRNSGGH